MWLCSVRSWFLTCQKSIWSIKSSWLFLAPSGTLNVKQCSKLKMKYNKKNGSKKKGILNKKPHFESRDSSDWISSSCFINSTLFYEYNLVVLEFMLLSYLKWMNHKSQRQSYAATTADNSTKSILLILVESNMCNCTDKQGKRKMIHTTVHLPNNPLTVKVCQNLAMKPTTGEREHRSAASEV